WVSLTRVSQVSPAIPRGAAEPVGEDERFAVLLQRLPIGPALRMHRHGEEPKLHALLRKESRVWSSAWRWTMRQPSDVRRNTIVTRSSCLWRSDRPPIF